ncbi:unnamed protein product, partial [Mesorhabditis spiculigera]
MDEMGSLSGVVLWVGSMSGLFAITCSIVNNFTRYPQYSFVLDYDDFFAGDATGSYPFTGLTLQMNACLIAGLLGLEAIFVGGFLIGHSFWMLDGHVRLSAQTRRLQLKLMKGLILQLAIPYLTLLFPWGLFAAVQVGDWIVDPGLLNFAFWFNSCHGTISSITILLFTDPYRKYLLKTLGYGTTQPNVKTMSVAQTTIVVTRWNHAHRKSA